MTHKVIIADNPQETLTKSDVGNIYQCLSSGDLFILSFLGQTRYALINLKSGDKRHFNTEKLEDIKISSFRHIKTIFISLTDPEPYED